MRRAPGRAGGPLHVVTDEPRQPRNPDLWDFGPPLDWLEDSAAVPFLDRQGNLVLPTNCPRRFRWWIGGQALSKTMEQLQRTRIEAGGRL